MSLIGVRTSSVLASVAAALTALATLACCLPWGVGAAFGALGLSVVFARFQVWLLALSMLLLGFGIFQFVRQSTVCRTHNRAEIALIGIAALVVMAVVLFPQWVAGLLIGRLP